MNEIIKAPFTKEQVKVLKRYQEGGPWHEFTCCSHDGCNRSENNNGTLIPTTEGFVCPCGKYKQDWAHAFMADSQTLDNMQERMDNLFKNKT